jgi:hypothetical protein
VDQEFAEMTAEIDKFAFAERLITKQQDRVIEEGITYGRKIHLRYRLREVNTADLADKRVANSGYPHGLSSF